MNLRYFAVGVVSVLSLASFANPQKFINLNEEDLVAASVDQFAARADSAVVILRGATADPHARIVPSPEPIVGFAVYPSVSADFLTTTYLRIGCDAELPIRRNRRGEPKTDRKGNVKTDRTTTVTIDDYRIETFHLKSREAIEIGKSVYFCDP